MPESTPPRAVVFDLDGLMFNTEDLYRRVGREVLRRRGRTADEAMFLAMMGRPPLAALQIMVDWHQLTDTPAMLQQESIEVMFPIVEQHLTPMPGLLDLLAALDAAGIPKAIATSSPRRFVDHVLGRFDLAPRFRFILTSDDITRGKPDPEIYQTAAARLQLPPRQVLVLEDSPAGCQSAVAAETFTVAVPSEYTRHHSFPGAALVAENLADPRIYAALGMATELKSTER